MLKISVCIPCYKRSQFAQEAIESILAQSIRPYEILIGDDSYDNETEEMVQLLEVDDVAIRYWHHSPSLGQSRNVQFLFQKAEGDIITLMHDDDFFLPGAFEHLLKPLQDRDDIIASFGMQIVISEEGDVDEIASLYLNKTYHRTKENEGVIFNSFEAGALAMFPNNGYFVRREAAQLIDYYDAGRASKACDYYFGLRLGMLHKPFYFCHYPTAAYRLTKESVARSGTDAGFYAFMILLNTLSKGQISVSLTNHLKSKVKVAIAEACVQNVGLGWTWYFSKWHRCSILSLGGMSRFLKLLIGTLKLLKPRNIRDESTRLFRIK